MTKYEAAISQGKEPQQDTFSIDGEEIAVDSLDGEEEPETLLAQIDEN